MVVTGKYRHERAPPVVFTYGEYMRVLLVEDDPATALLLTRALQQERYTVEVAANGEDALWLAGENSYDAIVLDVLIPAPDGLEVLRTLRERENWVPVLLLTGRDRVEDRITGLDAGADDYLTKPCDLGELGARVRALTRRAPQDRPTVLQVGDLRLDPALHEVRRGERVIALSATEYALLTELMRHAGRPLSRTHLIEQVWDVNFDATSNIVDVYIGYLRAKIDRPFGLATIETVRGAGYRMVAGEVS